MISKKDILRSSIKLRRKKKLATFSVFLLVFLFIFTGLAGLSQIDRFLIKKVELKGERTLSRDLIGQTVLKELDGRFLGLFPKNNSFIYRNKKIIDSLKDRFLIIKDVSMFLDDINTLVVEVEERQPAFVWCEEGRKSCYYADDDGLIFDKAPSFSEGVFFRFEGGMPSGKEPSYYLNKFIMLPENIKMLITFKQRAENIVKKNFSDKWKTSLYLLKEGDDIELFFEDGEKAKWKIIMAPRKEEQYLFKGENNGGVLKTEKYEYWNGFGGDLELLETNLNTVLSSKAFISSANESPDPLQNLEYIDLRFGKKIFYKFTN